VVGLTHTAERLSVEEESVPPSATVETHPTPAPANGVEERAGGFYETPANSLQPSTASVRQRSWFTRRRALLAAAGALLGGAALAFFILRGVSPTKDAAHLSPGPVRLAVLPFVNLTGHQDQEYLCDGLTDEMITVLGGVSPGRLAVIARTSSMTLKNSNRTAADIGRSLKVNYLLECSVREATNRLRINAQLIRTSDEVQVWAQEYDREMRDALNVQGEVAMAIADQIQGRQSPGKETRLASVHPVDPEVHELYLKGRYYWNKRTPETLKKSIDYFQKAAMKDPSYAPAYAGLADSYAMLGSGFYSVLPPKEAYPKAEAAAMKALELDPNQAEPHTALAWSKTVFDWDWQGAEREFKRAIELNPDDANAHHWYGYYLLVMGRPTEAIAEYRTAESLDPLSLIISSDLGQEGLAGAGLYDEEMEQCRKTLDMDPNFAEAHICMMNTYEQRGLHQEAIKEIQEAIRLSRDNLAYIAALGGVYAAAGRRVEAAQILNELKTRSKHEYVPSGVFFNLCAALGEKDQALAWLEKAYEEHDSAMLQLRGMSPSDPLRSDPRFQDLLRRMNFPP
jgi:TolB-like protein/Tfp pilus assembly protein PilF